MLDTVQGHSLEMGKSSTNFSATQPDEHCLNDTAGPDAGYPSEIHGQCQICEQGEKRLGSIA